MPQPNASQHYPRFISTKHLAETFVVPGIRHQRRRTFIRKGALVTLLQERPNKSFKRTPPAPRSVTPLAVGFQSVISVVSVFVYHGE
jgi:hypothetical protein